MKTLGIITTGAAAAVALVAVAVGIRSIPDVRRYLRIRSM
ncbi:DUF6893 family small protein [Streptomyces sp. NPDC015350]